MARRAVYGALVAAVLTSSALVSQAHAQDWSFGLEWGANVSSGDLNDYIDKMSWRNFGLDVRNYRSENWSLALSAGWHVFDQKLSNETAQIPNGAITGTQIRYVNTIPILLNGQYYFGERYARSRPFVGLGIGPMYGLQRLEIGIVALEKSNWHFAIAPEVGYAIGTGPLGDTQVVFRGAMYQAFTSGENLAGDEAEYTYFLVSIGVAMR